MLSMGHKLLKRMFFTNKIPTNKKQRSPKKRTRYKHSHLTIRDKQTFFLCISTLMRDFLRLIQFRILDFGLWTTTKSKV